MAHHLNKKAKGMFVLCVSWIYHNKRSNRQMERMILFPIVIIISLLIIIYQIMGMLKDKTPDIRFNGGVITGMWIITILDWMIHNL